MTNKKTLLLVLATILMLGLAVAAVVTSLRLRQLSTVPVAPNAPVSQPQAAETNNYVCQTSFTVSPEAKPDLKCSVKNAYKTSVSTANKLTNGAEISRGDTIVYEIAYENTGDAAGKITITDTLPSQVEFVSADSGCTHARGIVTCADIDVAAGASGTKKITVKVLTDAVAGAFDNVAKVTPSVGEETTCKIGLKVVVAAAPKCNDVCSSNSDCPADLKCIDNRCRNEKCSGESDCSCPLACNDYCANDSECPSGMKCSENKCRNSQCVGDSDCNCDKPPGCNEVCNPSNPENECVGGYVCDKTTNTCRNAACMSETDCTCEVAAKVTAPPKLPDAGSPIPGFVFLGAGAILLILGVLVAGL